MKSKEMQPYIEVSFLLQEEYFDVISDFINENISSGLIYEDSDKTGSVLIKFYVPKSDSQNYHEKLSFIFDKIYKIKNNNIVTFIRPDIKEREIENVEWEENYKKNIKVTVISEDVIVRPPWEDNEKGFKYDIVIEPKMAFGTGSHETTKSCLKIIRNKFKSGQTFLDMGCGSGVLSILADMLGASYIKAVDYDEISVENTKENFEINNVTTNYETFHGSIDQCDNDSVYDFVCANMIKKSILPMLERLVELTNDKGILVLSGLLEEDLAEVKDILFRVGLSNISKIKENEWRTLIVRKK